MFNDKVLDKICVSELMNGTFALAWQYYFLNMSYGNMIFTLALQSLELSEVLFACAHINMENVALICQQHHPL